MASPAQMAANRRNAQRSTGPRTDEGKQAIRLNAVKHGMTAKVIILGHESSVDYHEIRAALIESYAPASNQELMLVDQKSRLATGAPSAPAASRRQCSTRTSTS